MRTIGFWKHQFSDNGKQHIDDATLAGYIDIVNFMSGVFSEKTSLSSLDEAHDLLWLKNASMEQRATQQLLASWLNFANGAVGLDDMVDVDYDNAADMSFLDAVGIAEDILLDSSSSDSDFEQAKSMCDSINNMKESSEGESDTDEGSGGKGSGKK